jgi:isoamylase
MIALRRAHPMLAKEQFYTDAEISWFNPSLGLPDWGDPHARQLACLIHDGFDDALFLMFNVGVEAATFHIPAPPLDGGRWRLAVDTCNDTTHDVFAVEGGRSLESAQAYRVRPRSSVLLVGVASVSIHSANAEPHSAEGC